MITAVSSLCYSSIYQRLGYTLHCTLNLGYPIPKGGIWISRRFGLVRLYGPFFFKKKKKNLRLTNDRPRNESHSISTNSCVYPSATDHGPFGTFDSQKMLDALSKSPVFPGDTIRKLDTMKLSAKLMSYLPIGFPDGYLI